MKSQVSDLALPDLKIKKAHNIRFEWRGVSNAKLQLSITNDSGSILRKPSGGRVTAPTPSAGEG